MAGLEKFGDMTLNMVIPAANTVGQAIWSTFHYIDRNRADARTTLQRQWFTLGKTEQDHLNVFAAKTLFDVLELAIVSKPGMIRSIGHD